MSGLDTYQANAAAFAQNFQGVAATYTQPAVTANGPAVVTSIRVSLGPEKREEITDPTTGHKKLQRTRMATIRTSGTNSVAGPKTRDTVTITGTGETWAVVEAPNVTGAFAELKLALVTRLQITQPGANPKTV